MTEPDFLGWVDLETTGANFHDDVVMEVGLVLTDMELNFLGKFESVFRWSSQMSEQLDKLQIVKDMHSNNGLILECQKSSMDVGLVDDLLVAFLEEYRVPPQALLLAGSGISHFDRRFIERDFPKFAGYLHYANLDIGVVRRVFKYLGAGWLNPQVLESSDPDKKAHRALKDAAAHLREGWWYRRWFEAIREAATPGSAAS